MTFLTGEEKSRHLKAMVACLPEKIRKRVSSLYYRALEIDCIEVGFTDGRQTPSMKVCVDYTYKSTLGIRQRSWKMRGDGTYSYARVAAHIVSIVERVEDIKERRAAGESLATSRAERLLEHFKADKLLGSLNLQIDAEPVHHTESGASRFDLNSKCGPGVSASLISSDGESFDADFTAEGLSPEQVMAVMAVLRLDQLNLLELITLADDSILGPSINRMTADNEAEQV